jgi:Rieske Fe-S protein
MNQPSQITRKQFIKTIAVSTAVSAILGKSWSDVVASEIESINATNTGILHIRISDFAALQAASGSVRFAITSISGNSALPTGAIYPIIINKANNTFFAVSSKCTHEGCIVEKMSNANLKMTCLCHSSVYAIDGTKLQGPALSSLTKYTATFDGVNQLTIEVPGLNFSVKVTSVQPVTAGTHRLQLTFAALRNVSYEVKYQAAIDAAPVSVSFATTSTGPSTATVFKPTVNSPAANLFVDTAATTGFYSVAVKASSV